MPPVPSPTVLQNSDTNNAEKPKPSFYKRILPDSCTAFSSAAGKAVFKSALQNDGLKSFFPLMEQFTTQSEPAYCGISTLVVVLNALAVDPRQTWKGPWRWYREEMLNCCIDLEDVQKTGITLKDFVCLAQCQGLTVDVTHCDSDDHLAHFRQAVEHACIETEAPKDEDDPMRVLVVSYSRKVLGQTGSGHFSPIAAYDKASDKVLILDTARFKYGAHWVELPTLFEAMRPKDPDTDRSRGFALLSFKPVVLADASKCARCGCPQPVSLLFRSKMSANNSRRDYKSFLHDNGQGDISWDDVLSFWTEHDVDDVWTILEPLVLPTDCQDDVKRAMDMRVLLKELTSLSAVKMPPANTKTRATCFKPIEAIYVVYLASISPERRIVELNRSMTSSEETKNLLNNEAVLISFAINISDKISF